ncbi:GEVED domain-containing protein [Chryseobacterium formosus]|uniref:GEVED domain-containing protein n=1 Tax=Chryseobacterium formosus TaxID=1537363 RepID=A0ABT3XVS2_9FLAO|nr:GEVED domain-containing protein [Chryseobacterium formosus]MCX8525713.1 GEVED domain-containing protein [Chryseobacterium formosus]
MKKILLIWGLLIGLLVHAQVAQITTGTAGTPAYNAGPVYRSSTSSSYDASRYSYLYTASELAAAGITSGVTINDLGWVKNNNATTTGGGIFRIYMKNSTATAYAAASETWANLNSGATLVYQNLNQAIPATMTPNYIVFALNTPFTYTGGSLEISVEWDINQVTGNPSTGTFDWLWSTVPNRIYGTGNTTLAGITTLSSTTNSISTIDDRRPFLQIGYSAGGACSGAVTAGTASASATAVCANIPFNLVLTGATTGGGITYQWQRSPAGANTFTNIVGATTMSYAVTNHTAASDYRCVVTCTNGGSTQNSNIVTVGLNTGGQCLNYCTPIYTYNCGSGDDLNSFVITGVAPSIISDLNTGCNGAGYYDRTTAFTPVNLLPGQSYPVQINTTYSSPDYEKVSIWIDFNDNGTFDAAEKLLTDLPLLQSPAFANANIAIPLTAPAGVHRMRVRAIYNTLGVDACSSASYGETHDYNVNILALAPCAGAPVSGTASATTTNACIGVPFNLVLTGYTFGGGITYQWFSSPAGAGTFTAIAGATTPTYTVASQTVATDYRCVVTCANSSQSATSNIVSVGQNLPSQCYCTPTGGSSSNSYYFNNITTTLGWTNLNYTATSYNAYVNTNTTVLTSPGNNVNISLATTGGSSYYYKVWVDWNGDGVFANPGELVLSNANYVATLSGTIPVPAGTALGNYRVRTSTSYSGVVPPCGPAPYGNYVDFTLSVVAPPTCLPPTNFTLQSATTTSATVQWTVPSPAPAGGYDVYYSTSNTPPTAGTVPQFSGVSGPSQLINGLTPSTTYYVWVRAKCSSSDISYWSGPVTVFTNYCTPTGGSSSTSYYLKTVTTTGGFTNLNYTANTYQAYVNNSATSFSVLPNNPVDFSMNGGTSNYYYIWIDWNNDMVFTPGTGPGGEEVYFSNGYVNTATGTILTTGRPSGSYRARFATSWSGTLTPCGAANYGNYVDFTFIIKPCSTVAPTNVTVNTITHNSAIVNWTPSPDNLNYRVYWKELTSATWTNSSVILSPPATSYPINTGLQPATNYEVKVVAICNGTEGTAPSVPFATKCDPAPPTVTISNITPNSAVVTWNPLVASAVYTIRWRKVGSGVAGWQSPPAPGTPQPPLNSYTITGLDSFENYEVQVSTTCVGASVANPWSNPEVFTTIRVCEIPPPGLTITQLTPTTAEVIWDAYTGAGATNSYVFRYRKVGIPSWTTVNVNTNTYTITGLLELTKYEMQVANVCTGTPGNFTPLYYFTTPTVVYCQMGSTNFVSEFISKVTVTPTGKPQMTNTTAGSQYSDYTGTPTKFIEMIQGSTGNQIVVDKKLGSGAKGGVAVWIDFNRNGTFDLNERILADGPNESTTASATFNVPTDAFVSMTDYKYVVMRVAMSKDAIPVNCTSFANGEVEDYTVRISKLPVANALNQTDIMIYPNPVKSTLNVKNISKKANYKIYSAAGQLISSGIILNNKIDVSRLINGVYMIDIDDVQGTAQKKFIKE